MIDFRVYLDLEQALQRRLMKVWAPHAHETFAPIQAAIHAGNWPRAQQLAQAIDITPVVAQCREYTKYLLLACANFGASMATKSDTTLVSAGTYTGMLDRIADNFMAMAERSINLDLTQRALQLIAASRTPQEKKAGEFDMGLYAVLKADVSNEPRNAQGEWTREGALPPTAVVHYGNTPNLTALSGAKSGTGIKGAEARRLQYATDPAIKKRVYFYLAPGDALPKKESGLGNEVYRTTLNNLYDLQADPKGIFTKIGTIADPDDRANAMESEIVKAGYDGYAVPAYNMAVVLGKDQVPVSYAGNQFARKADGSMHLIAKDYVDGDPQNLLAPEDRHVKDLVAFTQTGNRGLQLVSSLHTSRLAVWGFTAEAEALGLKRYRLTAVLDNRTSKFCRWINGREFEVADAVKQVNASLNAKTADEITQVQPWPDQSKDAMESYKDMTDDDLVANGWCIPPFHPNCRTLCARVDSQPDMGRAPDDEAPDDQQPPEDQQESDDQQQAEEQQVQALFRNVLENRGASMDQAQTEQSFTPATQDSFAELGLKHLDQQALDFWNAYIPITPAEALAGVAGLSVPDAIEAADDQTHPPVIDFRRNGDVSFSLGNRFGVDDDSNVRLNVVYDPFTKSLYQNYLDVDSNDPHDTARYLKEYYRDLADAGQQMDANSLTLHAGGGDAVYTYATMGFGVSPVDWRTLRENIGAALDRGDVTGFTDLDPATQQAVQDLLASPNEQALLALVTLPDSLNGVPVGQALLNGLTADVTLDLTDPMSLTPLLESV